MTAELRSNLRHPHLRTPKRFDKGKTKPDPVDKEFNSGVPTALWRVPTFAMYTLAALAACDLTHSATATPLSSPEAEKTGDFVVPNLPVEPTQELGLFEDSLSLDASPESLVVQELTPEALQASALKNTQSEQNAQVPSPAISAAPQTAHLNPVTSETEVSLKSAHNQRSLPQEQLAAPRMASAQMLGGLQSYTAKDLQATPPSEPSGQELQLASMSETSEIDLKNCYASLPQETVNSQQTRDVVAQRVPTSSCTQVEQLQDELRDLEDLEVDSPFEASPALSIVIPTGFGADDFTAFISGTYQPRTRFTNGDDGAFGVGIGLGDARKAVGVELSYAIGGLDRIRDFGSGGFNVKVHRQLPNDWAIAAGWNGFLNLGEDNDFEDSIYGVVSKVIRTKEDLNSPFSRVALTAGLGSGQFRSEGDAIDDDDSIGVFGNVAVRVIKPVSVIAEWSGQDLGVGVSIAPFKNIPLVITPAVRDLTGAGDGARFVLGTGLAFKF